VKIPSDPSHVTFYLNVFGSQDYQTVFPHNHAQGTRLNYREDALFSHGGKKTSQQDYPQINQFSRNLR
jgi:hypothetical protein